MDDARRLARRGLVLLGYTVATGLLLHVVVRDLPWLGQRFVELLALAPELVRPSDPSVGLAVATASLLAAVLGLGALVVSRRTGTGFGLLAVATVTWIAFPYARVPWARVLGAPAGETHAAPPTVWLLAGTVVAIATLEMGACARERVDAELAHRGLGSSDDAERALARAHRRWQLGSLLGGAAIVLAFAATVPLAEPLAGGLDLLWVPALGGLVAGAVLWLWARG